MLKAVAGFTIAVAAKKMGDFDTARKFGTVAVENGNSKALKAQNWGYFGSFFCNGPFFVKSL